MDIVTYALCKKIAASAAAGIADMEVDGTTLRIELSDGRVLEVEFPTPEDGVSVSNLTIDNSKHLICTMSDGSTVDAGIVPEYIPQKGVDYYTTQDKQEIVQDVLEQVSGAVLEII